MPFTTRLEGAEGVASSDKSSGLGRVSVSSQRSEVEASAFYFTQVETVTPALSSRLSRSDLDIFSSNLVSISSSIIEHTIIPDGSQVSRSGSLIKSMTLILPSSLHTSSDDKMSIDLYSRNDSNLPLSHSSSYSSSSISLSSSSSLSHIFNFSSDLVVLSQTTDFSKSSILQSATSVSNIVKGSYYSTLYSDLSSDIQSMSSIVIPTMSQSISSDDGPATQPSTLEIPSTTIFFSEESLEGSYSTSKYTLSETITRPMVTSNVLVFSPTYSTPVLSQASSQTLTFGKTDEYIPSQRNESLLVSSPNSSDFPYPSSDRSTFLPTTYYAAQSEASFTSQLLHSIYVDAKLPSNSLSTHSNEIEDSFYSSSSMFSFLPSAVPLFTSSLKNIPNSHSQMIGSTLSSHFEDMETLSSSENDKKSIWQTYSAPSLYPTSLSSLITISSSSSDNISIQSDRFTFFNTDSFSREPTLNSFNDFPSMSIVSHVLQSQHFNNLENSRPISSDFSNIQSSISGYSSFEIWPKKSSDNNYLSTHQQPSSQIFSDMSVSLDESLDASQYSRDMSNFDTYTNVLSTVALSSITDNSARVVSSILHHSSPALTSKAFSQLLPSSSQKISQISQSSSVAFTVSLDLSLLPSEIFLSNSFEPRLSISTIITDSNATASALTDYSDDMSSMSTSFLFDTQSSIHVKHPDSSSIASEIELSAPFSSLTALMDVSPTFSQIDTNSYNSISVPDFISNQISAEETKSSISTSPLFSTYETSIAASFSDEQYSSQLSTKVDTFVESIIQTASDLSKSIRPTEPISFSDVEMNQSQSQVQGHVDFTHVNYSSFIPDSNSDFIRSITSMPTFASDGIDSTVPSSFLSSELEPSIPSSKFDSEFNIPLSPSMTLTSSTMYPPSPLPTTMLSSDIATDVSSDIYDVTVSTGLINTASTMPLSPSTNFPIESSTESANEIVMLSTLVSSQGTLISSPSNFLSPSFSQSLFAESSIETQLLSWSSRDPIDNTSSIIDLTVDSNHLIESSKVSRQDDYTINLITSSNIVTQFESSSVDNVSLESMTSTKDFGTSSMSISLIGSEHRSDDYLFTQSTIISSYSGALSTDSSIKESPIISDLSSENHSINLSVTYESSKLIPTLSTFSAMSKFDPSSRLDQGDLSQNPSSGSILFSQDDKFSIFHETSSIHDSMPSSYSFSDLAESSVIMSSMIIENNKSKDVNDNESSISTPVLINTDSHSSLFISDGVPAASVESSTNDFISMETLRTSLTSFPFQSENTATDVSQRSASIHSFSMPLSTFETVVSTGFVVARNFNIELIESHYLCHEFLLLYL